MKVLNKLAVALSVAVTLALGGVAAAAPRNVPTYNPGYTTVAAAHATDPACPGVYNEVTTVTRWGVEVNLPTGNNLVYVNQGGSEITTGSGNDCVIVNASGNEVNTGAGNDFIQGNSTGNEYNTGAGNDTINDDSTGNSLNGGAGVDTCNYDFRTSAAKNCEL